MDLTTRYAGLELAGPLVAGASPITHDVGIARRLEDAGVSAIVMHSLFEEQIDRDELSLHHHMAQVEYSHAEALSYFPALDQFALAPDTYVEQLARVKRAVSVPVIGSLNGATPGGWTRYAKLMRQAGADAIELNVYYVATDPLESSADVEQRYLETVRCVKDSVDVPVAVKLSPFFSAPVHMARRLEAAGADALVVFNRFYQPDIDIDALDVAPALRLSDSSTLLMRLRWLAALFGNVECSLAATGGVHTGRDALKALMAGASAVQITSAVLRSGPEHVAEIQRDLCEWMEQNEYESVRQMIGSMSLQRCPDPTGFERANYMKVLQSWKYGTVV
jgi:dihydroorotate dehydrogenase (fumarate)